MRSLLSYAAIAAITMLAGCDLYFGGDDDPPCAYGAELAPAQEFRNPYTGQCEPFGYGGCDDRCGPCPAYDIALPDWGACFSECEGLDENSCINTPLCHAAYNANSRVDQAPQFLGCWAIAPSGPAPGSCEGLDGYECSRHDNCAAYYDSVNDGSLLSFTTCLPEPGQGCYNDEECGPGAHCSVSDGDCQPPPGCEPGTACPAVCYGRCVMDQNACSNVDCGPGSHCEEQCYPCDSTDGSACDPICQPVCMPDQTCGPTTCPPGSDCVQKCDGVDPNNPGCGVCTIECVPSGTCEAIQTELECKGRADCIRVFQGENCTCFPNGTCTCETQTYDHCQTR
ncbi:MAG TPA: hypothetical protein VFQ53_25295 [Kofleriaceae bacterium]|nr:hypothetical protein [Kofleriaceae bacterium]